MRKEPELSQRPLKLGITPVGLSFIGFYVMIGVTMAGTWLVNLIMEFLRLLESQ